MPIPIVSLIPQPYPQPTKMGTGIIVLDRFQRANSLTTLGFSETGQLWQPTGTWGITNGQAYSVSNTGGNSVWLDSGISDGVISYDLVWATNQDTWGMFRFLDGYNYLLAGINSIASFTIYKRVAGTYTAMASSGTAISGTLYRFRIKLQGQNIIMFINDVLIATVSIAEFVGQTKHGLFLGVAGDSRWYNFRVEGK